MFSPEQAHVQAESDRSNWLAFSSDPGQIVTLNSFRIGSPQRHTYQMESPDAQQVRKHVLRMLQSNIKQGHDHARNFDYSYLCPSPSEYKWQWFWDSCFQAIAVAHVDAQQAERELETLFATQREDGFIGHIYFWGVRLGGMFRPWAFAQAPPGEKLQRSGLIQPPVIAQAVERVGEIIATPSLVPRFIGALDDYHEWLSQNRVPDNDGLIVIVSPYESGTDQSPAFDETLRIKGNPNWWSAGWKNRRIDVSNWLAGYNNAKMLHKARFYVKEALFNGLYADSLTTMARLHRKFGDVSYAAAYETLAERVTSSMLDKMLDRATGGFMSLVGKNERRVRTLTVGGLIPLVMPGIPQDIADEIIENHVMRRDQFWLRYPIPSVAANDQAFNPREDKLIWRGPTWVNTNWLLWRGMHRYGHGESADHLAARTIEMVAKQGLREFYNPLTGQGLGAESFGWSALALDMANL